MWFPSFARANTSPEARSIQHPGSGLGSTSWNCRASFLQDNLPVESYSSALLTLPKAEDRGLEYQLTPNILIPQNFFLPRQACLPPLWL